MKRFCILLFSLFFSSLLYAQQRDAVYYKKGSDPATSFIHLKEGYKLFSQKFGTGSIKILFLHGGPGNTHEYFEIFKSKLPLNKYQLIFYDQLGSYYSDQPNDKSLWTINRFVEEVEQVRSFYKLDEFYLLGHSWGGLLAMEYAIKYPGQLKGLIISNKSYSHPNLVQTQNELYKKTASDLKVSQQTLTEINSNKAISNRTEAKKIDKEFNKRHMIRMESMPDAMLLNSRHIINKHLNYFYDRQTWDIKKRLHLIKTPTLLIAGKYDFVREADLLEMKKRIKNSRIYICPNGRHFAFWDDTNNYFSALTTFISGVENTKSSTYIKTKPKY